MCKKKEEKKKGKAKQRWSLVNFITSLSQTCIVGVGRFLYMFDVRLLCGFMIKQTTWTGDVHSPSVLLSLSGMEHST